MAKKRHTKRKEKQQKLLTQKKECKLLENELKKIEDEREKIKNENLLLKEKIEELKKEKKDINDKLLRKAAEFENAKKIFQKQKQGEIDNNKFAIFKELLDIIDNFDRAIEHYDSTDNKDEIIKGIKLIDKNFHDLLARFNIVCFDSKGEIFDPSKHEALEVINDHKYKDGEIVKEFTKGYMYNEKILRPAKVAVNQISHKDEEND